MWHTKSADDTFKELKSGTGGLTETQARERITEYGPNELKEQGGRSPWKILFEQFTATMVLILIAAGVLALALGDTLEAVAIFSIVVLFGIMGFLQEFRAEKAMAALKKLSVPFVQVLREGLQKQIPAVDLVPGDLVILEAGNIVPADCRLTGCWGMKVQEAALTGESEAVEKTVSIISDKEAPLGDRKNMVYLGTQIVHGRAQALVTGTGMNTELGKIAALIQGVESSASPLQKRLEGLGRVLALVGVGISALVALFGVLAGEKLHQMLILGISLAVAIIPEGLPAVLTITLALGAGRMLSRHALIRKLPAVETLGSVTVICSDKTGTLTQNKMTVQDLWAPGGEATAALLGSLCNDAQATASGAWSGDPTETCLLDHTDRLGLSPARIRAAFPRVGELAFDATRKRMSTLHSAQASAFDGQLPSSIGSAWQILAGKGNLMAVKGSTDGLLAQSTQILTESGCVPLDQGWKTRVEEKMASLAAQGKRVLGFAFRTMDTGCTQLRPEDEGTLVFAGLVGIIDPPRPEVKEAMALCRSAGIRPVMITGDHPLTAQAIAGELGMDTHGKVITGRDLEAMEDTELQAAVNDCSVFARVSPEHKLRIVSAFQHHNQVVAMTGDGVNDAPALRKADIGVAMGITGTDVSKEASLMVLTDDNFASIVAAVEEGRVIYDNIRKYIKFSLGGNVGKIVALLLLPLATGLMVAFGGAPAGAVPVMVGLTAIQLLWLNLLCDGLLSVGLGVEHGEKGVMERKPVKPNSGVFNPDMNAYVLTNGLVMGVVSLGAGLWWWTRGADLKTVQTVVFMTLFFLQMWAVFSVRTGLRPLFGSGMKANRLILLMTAVSFGLQVAGMYVPFLRDFLSVTPLALSDMALLFGLSLVMIPVLEIQKGIQRHLHV